MKRDKKEPPAPKKNPSAAPEAKHADPPEEAATFPAENLLPRKLRDDERLLKILVDTLRRLGIHVEKLEDGYALRPSEVQRATGEVAAATKLHTALNAAEKAVKARSNPDDEMFVADEDADDLEDSDSSDDEDGDADDEDEEDDD